jgi:hypothetical protein
MLQVGGARVRRVHHTSTPRAKFEVGIYDAARHVLMVLHHQDSATL